MTVDTVLNFSILFNSRFDTAYCYVMCKRNSNHNPIKPNLNPINPLLRKQSAVSNIIIYLIYTVSKNTRDF